MKKMLILACEVFLSLLPESECDPTELAFALDSFEIDEKQVLIAAEKLPEYHDLDYKGVRLLICEYIKQFCRIFSKKDGRLRCEITVPAPLFLIMAFQTAGEKKLRFSTDALIAQIVLRSFFLYKRPIDEANNSKRFCGLNRMRLRLIEHFDYLIQFGVLCDECLKCGESISDKVKVLSVCYPKGGSDELRKHIADNTKAFISEVRNAMAIKLDAKHKKAALTQYAALVKYQNALLKLNRRTDRKALKGNSFALVQTVQLTVFDEWEKVLGALSLLTEELEQAPAVSNAKRIYCFYTPFLQPEIDYEFYRNGIQLIGSAVFLYNGKQLSFKLEDMVADWLFGMNVRADAATESEKIALEIKANNCCVYLTGMYGFDRWMGSSTAIHQEVLFKDHGIQTMTIDIDFWNEHQ